MRYDDASNTGSMAADSAPTARPDVEFLPQGDMGPATGNAITGAGTTSGASGADQVGDAPARIVEVSGASGPAAASGDSFQANGQYGVLTMDAQGNFSYTRNGGTPDGVQDVFGYTLADRDGSTSATTLTVNIGRDLTTEALGAAQGVVNLPPGVELSDIRVVGRDLVINMPDGTQMVIPGGAVFVPQLVIGDVEVPATNLAALLVSSEPQPAAGLVPSSGGNFAAPVPPLDPGVPLGDLIPPTELVFTPPEFEEPGQFIDEEPEIIIDPVDGAPAVNAVSDVDEAGLPARDGPEPQGTGEEAAAGDNGDTSETTTGVIDITSPDGIDGVTINDVLVTGVAGQTIAGAHGVLTITGFLPGGDIQYSYTLTDNTIGDDTHDDFEVTITDNDGDTATATLTINIVDDEPIARDDTDALAEGENSTDGNVLTAVGTTSTGADSPGADGFSGETNDSIDGVTGIRPGTGGSSFTAVAQDGTGVTVSGTFGDLTIHNDGSYTYTLHEGSEGGGNDVFTYQITDGDGDVDTATLTITVPDQNDPPTAEGDEIAVSEEGLPDANPDDTGNPDTTNLATANGNIGASDPDGDALNFTLGVPNPNPNFTSNGAAVNWQVSPDGNTLIGYTGGDPDNAANHVITVVITDGTSGSYTVTLHDQIDHPDPTTEDAVDFTIPVTVDDGTAPPVETTIVVSIEDDSPVPADNEGSVTGQVDEDALPAGNNDAADGDDPGGTTASGGVGSLLTLFDIGADQPGKIVLLTDTTGLPSLTSNNVAVTYSVVGNVLTAEAGAGNTVFTLTVNADGSWSFELEGQLDHPDAGTEDNLLLDFSSIISAEDADGDPADGALPAGSFVIDVDDDMPANNGETLTPPTVHEDALNNEDAVGNPEGVGQTVNASITVASILTLADVGADQPGTVALNPLIDNVATGLTQGGTPIVWDVVSATQVRGIVQGTTDVVFTLTYDAVNEEYDFVLLDNIDHDDDNDLTTGEGEDALESLSLDGVFTVTDADDDPVVVNGGISINIENDVPQDIEPEPAALEQQTSATFDLDLAGPDGDLNGVDDNYGADGPGTVRFPSSLEGTNATDADGKVMTSGGGQIVYHVSPDGLTLFGYVDDGTTGGFQADEDTTVFTVTLDPTNSEYTVNLVGKIDSLVNRDFTETDFDFVGGNEAWFGIVPNNQGPDDTPVEDDSQDLLITPINGPSINTSGILGGVDTGQDVDVGEGFRIDYVLDLKNAPPNDYVDGDDNNHNFDGHWNTPSASVSFRQSTGTTLMFQAFDDTDGDDIVGDGTQEAITGIVITWDGVASDLLTPTDTVQEVTLDGPNDDPRTFTYVLDDDGMSVIITNVGGATGNSGPPETRVTIFTEDGFSSLEVENIGGDDIKFSGFGAAVESEEPVDFSVPVEIVDADGDVANGEIDVSVYPVGGLPAPLTLLSANDNQEQQKSGNTMIMAAALAAAGLATEPLAASTKGHDGKNESQQDQSVTSDNASPAVDAGSDDLSAVSGLLDGSAAKDGGKPANDSGNSNDDAAAGDKGVHNEDAPAAAVSELSQGTDAPTQSEASAPMMADAVAMPSAEQIIAASGKDGGTPADDGEGKDVGKVLADALNGGENGKDLDALINAVAGQDNANDALASHGGHAVSNGDMGAHAGLAAMQSDDIMTQLAMHQDAAPAHA